MAIIAHMLILPRLLPDFFTVGYIFDGIVGTGEDDITAVVGPTGGATASFPGFVGSFETSLQFNNGGPQRPRLSENTDSGKDARNLGISPDNLFPETLKS